MCQQSLFRTQGQFFFWSIHALGIRTLSIHDNIIICVTLLFLYLLIHALGIRSLSNNLLLHALVVGILVSVSVVT